MPFYLESRNRPGAALETLVLIANTSDDTIDELHKAVDIERKRNTKLIEQNLRLERALEQAKLELKLERQNKFATNQQKEEDNATDGAKTTDESSAANQPRNAALRSGILVGFGRRPPTTIGPSMCLHPAVARTARDTS